VTRFPALAYRNFRLYFIGQAIALIGGFAHAVAISWLAYRLTHSAAILGLVGFATTLPTLIVSPIAGVLGDRFPRRRVIMLVLSAVSLQCLTLAFLTWMNWINATGLVWIALLRGTLFAIEIPARHALLGELVPDRTALPNAVALHSSALNTARFIGPAVGGVLIAATSEVTCFLLHALTLMASIAQLSRIQLTPSHHAAGKASMLSQLRQGLQYSFAHSTIRTLLMAIFVVGFTTAPYAHLMPSAVADLYSAHPELVGMFLSAAGFGAMCAAVMLAMRRSTRRLPQTILAASVCAGAGLLLFSLSSIVALSLLGMAMVGFGTIAQAASTNMIIQSVVDEDKRGRVMAIYTAMFLGAMPIGSLTLGQLGEWLGAARALALGGACCLCGAAYYATRMGRLRI
jgi:MFS family permease